jgi:hypothetical protein
MIFCGMNELVVWLLSVMCGKDAGLLGKIANEYRNTHIPHVLKIDQKYSSELVFIW